jgi:protein-serine/threonine kinase
MNDITVSEARKQAKLLANRRSEATYLRFLRTKERVENFQTLKIIGKGAFGEVRLVSRKENNKIFALKSLIKSEMV